MNLYARIAASQTGSSALFGGTFFAATLPVDGLSAALATGGLAAASWFAIVPMLKRVSGGQA